MEEAAVQKEKETEEASASALEKHTTKVKQLLKEADEQKKELEEAAA